MIEAIKEIGEYIIQKKEKNIEEPLDILIDNPESNPKKPSYKNILLILLKKANGGFDYKGIDIEEYSHGKLDRYLYKKSGGSNSPDITPTSRVTEISKTFVKKILKWFNNYTAQEPNENTNFLVKVGNCLRNNKDKILDDLKEKHSGIDRKEKSIITLKIDNRYIGEYDIIKEILLEESIIGFYSKYGKISKAENMICSVCNEKKSEVYGFVDTYKFYTVDKPGFVSGGFQQKDAWKNYPVCLECALKLEAGKKYLQENLNFNFYGFNYQLIPKFINREYYENKKDIFELIEGWRDPKFNKEGRKGFAQLTQDENEILELMSKQENYLNMNFMFYEAPNGYDGSVFNILLYIEDILPSRLRRLFEIKREVDKINIFKDCMVPIFENKKKTGEKSLEFNFGILRTFFRKVSDKRTYNKYFLDLTSKIFTSKPIDYYFLLQFIMLKIRDEFVNNNPTKISTLKGFMLLNYLNKLGLVELGQKSKKEVKMNDNNKRDVSASGKIKEKTDGFFKKFADFFDSDAKKAIFLEGVLTQFLLNIQYQERNATPFRVKLKGLKLDEKQVKKLLPEIQNKLEEYGKNYYRTLESIISDYFVSAGNGWKLTNDEISFYFVLGMNLSDLFKVKADENEIEEE
ncbi:TIGR02556 family CRISPR-associated protein [bacterium]|nr:TIGR02556 family CRISPR-associated protein [bacterium]